jgi:cysteinyl-tRNA synthetase
LSPNEKLCAYALDVLVNLCSILTLFQTKAESDEGVVIEKLQKILVKYDKAKLTTVDELMDAILKIRTDARLNKDWKTADEIRDKLQDIGFEIQDTDEGTTWRKK